MMSKTNIIEIGKAIYKELRDGILISVFCISGLDITNKF